MEDMHFHIVCIFENISSEFNILFPQRAHGKGVKVMQGTCLLHFHTLGNPQGKPEGPDHIAHVKVGWQGHCQLHARLVCFWPTWSWSPHASKLQLAHFGHRILVCRLHIGIVYIASSESQVRPSKTALSLFSIPYLRKMWISQPSRLS